MGQDFGLSAGINLPESLWEVTLYFKGTVHPRRKNNWLSTLMLIESLVKFCGPRSINKNSQSLHTSVFACYLVACVTHNKESCSDFAAWSASIRSNFAFLAFDLLSYCCSFFSGQWYTKIWFEGALFTDASTERSMWDDGFLLRSGTFHRLPLRQKAVSVANCFPSGSQQLRWTPFCPKMQVTNFCAFGCAQPL